MDWMILIGCALVSFTLIIWSTNESKKSFYAGYNMALNHVLEHDAVKDNAPMCAAICVLQFEAGQERFKTGKSKRMRRRGAP